MSESGKLDYPIIFVHGMFGWGQNEGINKTAPYWGATTGSLTDYLTKNGIECYAASVGPMSSAWDQACELYAQLTGTRVDYGKAHSKKYGHKRFGRTYSAPLFKGWSKEKKVHLIGHSFGGNACRMLAHLLTYGSPEEKAASGDDISPLFTGNKEELVFSVTAICTPLNGTDAYETARKYKLIFPLKYVCCNFAGIIGRSPLNGKFADYHLEQFGLSNTPGSNDKEPFVKSVRSFFLTKDNIAYDMSEQGADDMNKLIRISPKVYYFSYSFNSVEKSADGKKDKARYTDFILMKATSSLMLRDGRKSGRKTVGNDGLVDVDSARYPKTEPFDEFVNGREVKAGLWNVMPTRFGDHGTPIGLFADKSATHSFYESHIFLLLNIEKKSAEAAEV